MAKVLSFFLTLFLFLQFFVNPSLAKSQNSFVSIVNPIRGEEVWDEASQTPLTAVVGEVEILKKYNLSATWLVRYDALFGEKILAAINSSNNEKGLFLEITPNLARDAQVTYNKSRSWHSAASAFLSGYEVKDREKIIDRAFEKFKEVFGQYPKSVGAWWIDSVSMDYMKEKYEINGALIVADQYTTDDYQIWGQYWSTPYYPAKKDVLNPAQSLDNKIDVVVMQWAPRDPVNAYGNGVQESTYSVQANDYIDYHNLDTNYFSTLIDIYSLNQFNKFSQVVVGLENSYNWGKYKTEYENQVKTLSEKVSRGQISVVTMDNFSKWYKQSFKDISPSQIVIAKDPLGTNKETIWFMNPYYRVGLFINNEGVTIRDLRQYVLGDEELCYNKKCSEINFATFATRVLDDVTYGHKWVIDEGKISNLKITKANEEYVLTYTNETNKNRQIKFLPRDIVVDEKISSIDGAILDATKANLEKPLKASVFNPGKLQTNVGLLALDFAKFILFLIFTIFLPTYFFIKKDIADFSFFQKIFIGLLTGIVITTLSFYILSLLKLDFLIFAFPIFGIFVYIKERKDIFKEFNFQSFSKLDLLIIFTIIGGTLFQIIPTFQSGLIYEYGMGFWGPNTHDGVWHISLINQLLQSVPPNNPIFSGEILKNYHFFYDLLVAVSAYILQIPIVDLLFRFYPFIFSALLGIGTYYLMQSLFYKSMSKKDLQISTLFALIFVYFAGSFGWIVEFMRSKSFSGESAFWANQSISYNLNPPFAISLLILIAIFQLLPLISGRKKIIFLVAILSGSLIAYKAYAGVLILGSLLLLAVFKRSFVHLLVFVLSTLLSILLYIPNFSLGQQVLFFSPFWFIHSMIDAPDRVGWTRLTLTRQVGLSEGNYVKFIGAETIGLIIFTIGNLGTRFMGFFALIKIKRIFGSNSYLLLFIFSLLSFFIPLLFIQAGNPWNTIQFFYYFLYIISLFSGVVLATILGKGNKSLALLVILPILFITPINAWATANSYFTQKPHGLISLNELEALNFLQQQSKGTVLTYPYDRKLRERLPEPWPLYVYDSTAYVSAISQKGVFVEDEPQNQILLTDYKKRVTLSKQIFNNLSNDDVQSVNALLKEGNIKFIYLLKAFNISPNSKNDNLKKVFDNKEVEIYQIENNNG